MSDGYWVSAEEERAINRELQEERNREALGTFVLGAVAAKPAQTELMKLVQRGYRREQED